MNDSNTQQGFTMRIIRWFLGTLILFFDWLTTPRGIQWMFDSKDIIGYLEGRFAEG